MRVLLVHPEFPLTYWGFQHSLEFLDRGATLPPLGLLTLAALLPRAWQLRLVDMNLEPLDDEAIAWADAVLISGMLIQAPSAVDVLTRARRLGRQVIVGGPACTTSPELFSAADHVFLGEAEGRQHLIVEAIESPGTMPHELAGLPDERPAVTASPVPRFDLAPLSRYRSMSVQFSRGCPFSCEFCDIIEIFGRVPRVKSPAQILAELDALYELGWRGPVFFVDDNFIGNKRAVRGLLPEVEAWQRRRRWPFTFFTEASVNLAADAELLSAMVGAGFDSVFLGIETPSEESLRGAKKKQNAIVDLREAVDTITAAGLAVMGGFIVGFDEDDERTFEAQREFIARSPIPLAMMGILTALPGTQLWRRLEGEGRLRADSNGDAFTFPNFVPRMGDRPLLAGYARLMRELYSAEGYYARCEALIDRVGPVVAQKPIARGEVAIAARAVLRIGVLGERRRHFWRLMARAARRGLHAVHRAFTHAIQGEHLIRYTQEVVLPRIEQALAAEPSSTQDAVSPRRRIVRLRMYGAALPPRAAALEARFTRVTREPTQARATP